MDLPAKIIGPDKNYIDVTLYDLSPDSAQIRFLIRDGSGLFQNKSKSAREIEALKFIIHFELDFKGTSIPVNLNSHPIYLRTVDDEMMAAGMLFIENALSETKKVSDFLFFQFESSFTDSLYYPRNKRDRTGLTAKKEMKKIKNGKHGSSGAKHEPGLTGEEQTGQIHADSDMEYLKREFARMTALMKVIQETTRHIDERIYILESKLERK